MKILRTAKSPLGELLGVNQNDVWDIAHEPNQTLSAALCIHACSLNNTPLCPIGNELSRNDYGHMNCHGIVWLTREDYVILSLGSPLREQV